MKIKEAGQAFILVLILLAIGAVLIVPALRLTNTGLQASQIISRKNTGLYAAEAAQQKIMWMLFRGNLAKTLTSDVPVSFTVDVCGAIVNATIVMRVVESKEGIILAGDHTIMPTKTVTPSTATQGVDDTFEYTIRLEQVSSNTTNGLDAIYDILPAGLKTATAHYVPNSSYFRVEGDEWEQIGDPEIATSGGQYRLRWPNPDTYGSESFLSPIRDFVVGQVKELKFEVYGRILEDKTVQCNWVVLQVGDVFTVSGPQAPIVVGDVPLEEQLGCASNGLFEVYKTSYPEIIPPLKTTPVTYTIHITNMDGNARHISQIEDYLPPGFEYVGPTSGNITNNGPIEPIEVEDKNGVMREHLIWDEAQLGGAVLIKAGETLTLTFVVEATQGISGSYYNEVLVYPSNPPEPALFSGISPEVVEALSGMYSWNSGTVIVPAFDSETESDGETVHANLALSPLGVIINSWQVK